VEPAHAARSSACRKKALSDDHTSYLAGSTLAGWRAIGLRKLTDEAELAQIAEDRRQ